MQRNKARTECATLRVTSRECQVPSPCGHELPLQSVSLVSLSSLAEPHQKVSDTCKIM